MINAAELIAWPLRSGGDFKSVISQHMLRIWFWSTCQIAPGVNATEHLWWEIKIGSSIGLSPSGNKPLPDPMLTQITKTMPQSAKMLKLFVLEKRIVIANHVPVLNIKVG